MRKFLSACGDGVKCLGGVDNLVACYMFQFQTEKTFIR